MSDEPKCPYCEGPMHVQPRKDGGKFYSCDRFPNCRGSAPITGEKKPELPSYECDPKFRADGALALAVAMVQNIHYIADHLKDGETVAMKSVAIIDELIIELQK